LILRATLKVSEDGLFSDLLCPPHAATRIKRKQRKFFMIDFSIKIIRN
jgi:hypothetical protein